MLIRTETKENSIQKVLIISHIADWDGIMSAAILKEFINRSSKRTLIAIALHNYNEDFIETIEVMKEADIIYITDFSLPLEVMKKFESKIIYIDHHPATVNEILENCNLREFHCNVNSTMSAAALVWEYLYTEPIPSVVHYVSEYDISGGVGKPIEVTEFQLGLSLTPMTIEGATRVLKNASASSYIDSGKNIYSWISAHNENSFAKYSWDVKLGKYKGKAIITDWPQTIHCGDSIRESNDFVFMLFPRRGSDDWNLSVRVSANSDFDACEFCHSFGGGGHVKAAGCIISNETFMSIRHNNLNYDYSVLTKVQ